MKSLKKQAVQKHKPFNYWADQNTVFTKLLRVSKNLKSWKFLFFRYNIHISEINLQNDKDGNGQRESMYVVNQGTLENRKQAVIKRVSKEKNRYL